MNQHRDDKNRPGSEGDWFDRELSRHELPSARSSFKQDLRDAFQSGEFPERATSEEFRTQLRERFVEGRLDSKPVLGRILRFALPLAAAALLIFTQLPMGIGDSLRWETLEMGPDASVLGAISDWQEIHTGKERLRLGYGPEVFVEIGASSLVERTGANGEHLTTREGSLLFTAATGEEPISFLIETPDAVIQITSNSVGVDIYEEGTCVCVLDGEVVVTPRVGERQSHSIGPGRSCFVKKDGALILMDSLQEAHSTPIVELKEFAALQKSTG